MASKNSKKIDVEGGIYHVYNRGVEKRNIFVDDQDYGVFLNYVAEYLSSIQMDRNKNLVQDVSFKDRVFKGIPRQPNNYNKKVELLTYCLMPNHFHFILKQIEKSAMKQFVHSLLLRYSSYFNKRHKRVGPLFQGRYKAILVDNEAYLLHLSRYIHLNPFEFSSNLETTNSSYLEYLGKRKTEWVNSDLILSYFNSEVLPDFKKVNSYKDFVERYNVNAESMLGNLTLDID